MATMQKIYWLIFLIGDLVPQIYIYIYLFFTHTYCPPDYFKHLYYKREAFFSVHYTVLGRILSFLRFSSNTNQNSYEVLGRAFGPQFFVGFS